MDNFVVLLGTRNVQMDCSITTTNSIGSYFNALQVFWKLNGTEISHTIPTPLESENIEHTDSFTSTLTVNITEYDKAGNYCCIASLAGIASDVSNCILVIVSGSYVRFQFLPNEHCINFLEIAISGDYSDLQVGRTQNITCTVPGIPPEAVMWSGTWSKASLSSDVLMLSSIDSTLNGNEFICSVKSNKLFIPSERKITFTVQG